MRLTSIKLSGFKSFVDSTHFETPGQLVGIVGPNGCGKSNIIDAVRWVLGESRAAELRGESMQDVIFNGSTIRKPASRASIELIFNNSLGRIGGQWGQYAELAIKRVLTRDGASNYYINNIAARRRDIQDIFLGTGLGPRAYAIIGQGMISRILESKPEELRVFLEEAAGVSKYKERRRETENRLRDTRDNLLRVEDILRELSTQLEKLEVQAKVAQHFKSLQAEGQEKQQLLWLLRKRDAENEQQKHQQALQRAQLELDSQGAELRAIEADLEMIRATHYDATDHVQTAQGALYEANAEVSRLEAEIRFVSEHRNRLQVQLSEFSAQRDMWQDRQTRAEAELLTATEEGEMAAERSISAQTAVEMCQESLPVLEQQWREMQQNLNTQRTEINELEQNLKLEAAHQHNADQRLEELKQRQARFQNEIQELDAPDLALLETTQEKLSETQVAFEDIQIALDDMEGKLPVLEEARSNAQKKVHEEATAIAQLEAQLLALKQLQEQVQVDSKVQPWLEKHELAEHPRLWKKIHIEPGWETALEAVLRERLFALEVSQLDWVKAFAQDAPPAKFSFYAPPSGAQNAHNDLNLNLNLKPLLSLLRIDDASIRGILQDWLAPVFIAENLESALALRSSLPLGTVIVTPQGHQISRGSVQLYAADSEQAGLLARQQEIENLDRQWRAQILLADDAKTKAVQAEAAYSQISQRVPELRIQNEQKRKEVHELQMELLKLSQLQERYEARSAQIGEALAEVETQIEEQKALYLESESRFESFDLLLAERQAAFEDKQIEFEQQDERLAKTRDELRQLEHSAHEARFQEKEFQNRLVQLGNDIAQAKQQLETLTISFDKAQEEFAKVTEQTAENGLEQALAIRVEREQALFSARTDLDALAFKLRQTDEQRLMIEQGLQPLRDRIAEFQLKEQAVRLNAEQYAEQLVLAQVDENALAEKLLPDLKVSWLQSEITRIDLEITALGAVNMAALEELQAARERKFFMDSQSEDLGLAIKTLEDAIRKIDHETRALLQTTFDQVNLHFGELFPALFGGGQAKLIMLGDEMLDAGVQVMAQPPGKKNTTIHLLSGGEKALVAIALVFAMFQLNPAPFCLLDEVDAPLDDANTARFAKLVQKMSDKTQFLFITHNKIAMEMAEQLIGVTMQEQGVSRIVAVDIQAAVDLAEAA